jgi:hypothetical protein
MRVGVIEGFLSRRYLGFWEAYLKALGVEVVRAGRFLRTSASPTASRSRPSWPRWRP